MAHHDEASDTAGFLGLWGWRRSTASEVPDWHLKSGRRCRRFFATGLAVAPMTAHDPPETPTDEPIDATPAAR
jgi:hypothetical protein